MSPDDQVALYCYEFAPEYKVGGRRWRLFAPRLAERGLHILLRAKAPSQEVKLDGIRDASWFKRPRGWLYPWSDVWAWRSLRIWRIQQALARCWLQGNPHDETIFLQPWIRKQVRHDLKVLGVKTFVVSCPAFHWAHTIAHEIARHNDPKVRLVIDFRDGWSDNRLLMPELSEAQRAHEERLERETLRVADAVVCVAPRDLEVRKRLAEPHNIAFHTLRNGVVIPEHRRRDRKREPKSIHLLFAGWIYPPGQPVLVSFLRELAKFHPVQLTVAGNWPPELMKQIREEIGVLELGYLPHESIEKLLRTHDFALSFVAQEVSYAINTKILEAAAQRTPLVLLSGPGEVTDFVRDNRLGVVADPAELERGAQEVVTWWASERQPGPWTTFEAHHNLEKLADEMFEILSGQSS